MKASIESRGGSQRLIDHVAHVLMALGVVFWSLVVLLVVCLGICASTWVTDRQLNRLHNGMTKAEVISILGSPLNPNASALQYYAWCKRTDPIVIFFDDNGLLTDIR